MGVNFTERGEEAGGVRSRKGWAHRHSFAEIEQQGINSTLLWNGAKSQHAILKIGVVILQEKFCPWLVIIPKLRLTNRQRISNHCNSLKFLPFHGAVFFVYFDFSNINHGYFVNLSWPVMNLELDFRNNKLPSRNANLKYECIEVWIPEPVEPKIANI